MSHSSPIGLSRRSTQILSFLSSGESNVAFSDHAPSIFPTQLGKATAIYEEGMRKKDTEMEHNDAIVSVDQHQLQNRRRSLHSIYNLAPNVAKTDSRIILFDALSPKKPASIGFTWEDVVQEEAKSNVEVQESGKGLHVDVPSQNVTQSLQSKSAPTTRLASPSFSPILSQPLSSKLKKYFLSNEDFATVDWSRDQDKQHSKRIQLVGKNKESWREFLLSFLKKGQSWYLLALIAVAIGFFSALINTIWSWLDAIRNGYCSDNFFLNKKVCCGFASLNYPHTLGISDSCSNWKDWSSLYSMRLPFNFFGWDGQYIEYMAYVVGGLILSLLGTWLVCTFAVFARSTGIPEIKSILNGTMIKYFLGGWTLVIKVFGLILSVSSGLVVGKEGPLVHISCCCANVLMRFFPSLVSNEAFKREILSASAAAGIAVAFGAPVGGVLFSYFSFLLFNQLVLRSFLLIFLTERFGDLFFALLLRFWLYK